MKTYKNYHYLQEWEAALEVNDQYKLSRIYFVLGNQSPGHLLVDRAVGQVTIFQEHHVAEQIIPLPKTYNVLWDYQGRAFVKTKREKLFDIPFHPKHD